MAAIVGLDARIDIYLDGSWTPLSERNEFSINIRVDTAEHKAFVASPSAAWSQKIRTWMSWSGSLRGYYDDADDSIFDTMVAGAAVSLRFYDTRADLTKYWQGRAILTNVEHGTNTDDYITHSVDFDGVGALCRVTPGSPLPGDQQA